MCAGHARAERSGCKGEHVDSASEEARREATSSEINDARCVIMQENILFICIHNVIHMQQVGK